MAKSYKELEDELRKEATKCLSMAQAVTHPGETRDWLEAVNQALIGAKVARRAHLVEAAHNPNQG